MFITALGSSSKGKAMLKRSLAIMLMTAVLLTSAFSVAALSKTVVVHVDGKEISVNTLSTDEEEILTLAEVALAKNDLVTSKEEDGVFNVFVKRAFNVTLTANGETETYAFAQGTVADVLKEANITLDKTTKVDPAQTTELTKGLNIEVGYFKTVVLKDAEKEETVLVPVGTVKNALSHLNIVLGENDKINVKLTDTVADNMNITITRVEYKNVKTTQSVDFETEVTYTDELEPGETKTVTKGVKGEKEIITRQKLVNGKVKEKEVVSEEVTKQPKNKEVLEGQEAIEQVQTTYTTVTSTAAPSVERESGAGVPVSSQNGVLYDESGNEVSYSAVHHGSGTAYYAPAGSLTATGNEVYVGGVAVNPNIIPYGSKLYIVADDGFVYGYATAIDTGGALMSGDAIVDVFYYTYDECVVFGRRNVSVYVLS